MLREHVVDGKRAFWCRLRRKSPRGGSAGHDGLRIVFVYEKSGKIISPINPEVSFGAVVVV